MYAKIVTGYVPIPGNPRGATVYGQLGELLRTCKSTIHPFYQCWQDCWATTLLKKLDFKFTHSEGDNPVKNSIMYHIVQHQKIEWLRQAMLMDQFCETFVWVDYGVFHLPGVTATVIDDFMGRLAPGDLAIPGCWNQQPEVPDEFPSWRFCGTVLVCPRQKIIALDEAIKAEFKKHVYKTHNVDWEINTWARVELKAKRYKLPIRWYPADHNETLFTNYGAPND